MIRKSLLLLFFALTLSACSYSGKILLPEDASQAMLQKGKYDLKAAIVVTRQQEEEKVRLQGGLEFKPYPEMYQLAQMKFKKLFSAVDIVKTGEIKDPYDVLINSSAEFSLGHDYDVHDTLFDINFFTEWIDPKSGNTIFRTSNKQVKNFNRYEEEEMTGGQAAGLILAAPVSIPVSLYKNNQYSEKMVSALLAKAMDETVESLPRNKKFIALVERYKPGRPTGLAAAPVVKSDVDELPVFKIKPRKNAYAIVIGIENYRQKLPTADFATHDAQTMAEYLVKVFGYPEENVITLLNDNASNVDLAKYFEKWLPNNVEPNGTVFVYYSGHGAPNPKTGDAYLVPYDGDPSFIDQTGYSLQRLYNALGKLPAKEVVVALDSCFSGAGGRSVLAQGARPLVINLEKATVLPRNLTVMSAASGDQISSTYQDKGHGLFTYFMLKGIKTEDVTKPDGTIRIDDLFGYVKPQVERIARKNYNNEQSPQLMGQK